MDEETRKTIETQKNIKRFVESDDWRYIRSVFTEKILDLQNAFNINDESPEKTMIDLRARKLSSIIMTEFLREIEGTAQQAEQNTDTFQKHIVKFD